MTTKAGIWIDHRKAVIVTLSPEGEHTTLIASNVEKHLERGGNSMTNRQVMAKLRSHFGLGAAGVQSER